MKYQAHVSTPQQRLNAAKATQAANILVKMANVNKQAMKANNNAAKTLMKMANNKK